MQGLTLHREMVNIELNGMYVGYIYRHWRVLEDGTEKSYIGLTTRRPKDRWGINGKGYAPYKGKESTYFYNAICKYGWDNFNHDILLKIECRTKEELNIKLKQLEIDYIAKYDSFYNGYNSTLGGDGTLGLSGEKHPNYGKPLSEEHKSKVSTSLKGKKKGPQSHEHKRKNSEAHKGEKNPNYGKPRSEETKRKQSKALKGREFSDATIYRMSESHSKKVICLETLQVFQSAKAADEWNGLKSGVNKCCRGERKTVGKHPITGEKLHWMYYDKWLELNNENSDTKAEEIA